MVAIKGKSGSEMLPSGQRAIYTGVRDAPEWEHLAKKDPRGEKGKKKDKKGGE
jgi:hypothetical protein